VRPPALICAAATAQVWQPLQDGLQGVNPFKGVEPVIKTGNLGIEPAEVPDDPTGTGRYA